MTNARLIDPASGMDRTGDMAIADGLVAAIGASLQRSAADRVIDAKGAILCPGLIDPHVHLREPGGEHKETLRTGGEAAISGGFTAVCCMPNTTPALDTPEALRDLAERAARTSFCRIFPVAAATKGRKGDELAEIDLLARAGAVGFSDDGDCVASAGMMSRVLGAVSRTGLVFMQHAQEPTLTRGASMHAGEVSVRLGLTGWPRVAEELIVERDLRLVRHAPCRYHVQHVSSAGTVELLRRARSEGLSVSGEASPHHLLLTHTACDGYNTLAKVNPPLREDRDVAGLREGVRDGTITVLATDHAPHAPEEKSLPFEEAPFGLIGLQTALPLYAEALVHTGILSWPRLVAMLTVEPARLCGLDTRGLGRLEVGGPADATIFDPDRAWTIEPLRLAGLSKNTPFAGRQVRGRVTHTIAGGVVRFELDR